MPSQRKLPVHPSVRKTLGYTPEQSDKEIYADWKERTSRVCKPCWELKYCPYGPLVEQSPLLPTLKSEAEPHMEYFKQCLKDDVVGSKGPLSDDRRGYLERWIEDEQALLSQALFQLRERMTHEAAAQHAGEDKQIEAWLGGPLPPIEEYRVQFDHDVDSEIVESDFSADVWQKISSLAAEIKRKYQSALETNIEDNRQPMEPARRAWFRSAVDGYNIDDHPDEIPQVFLEGQCNIFGHICPVFFSAEAITESREERRIGRRNLDFATKMRIVRRDNYQCQECGKGLRDDEVEFDHIIPVSKGGSSEEHNLRLTCYDCNNDKSNHYIP